MKSILSMYSRSGLCHMYAPCSPPRSLHLGGGRPTADVGQRSYLNRGHYWVYNLPACDDECPSVWTIPCTPTANRTTRQLHPVIVIAVGNRRSTLLTKTGPETLMDVICQRQSV